MTFPDIKNIINGNNENKKSVKLPPRNKDDLDEGEPARSSDRSPASPYPKDSKLAVSLDSFKHLELKNADDSCSDKSIKDK